MDQGTRVSSTTIHKRKETYDTRDLHPAHARGLIAAADKDAVVTGRSLEPRRCCPNRFLLHTLDIARVTRGVKCCRCMVEDTDTTGESCTVVTGVFVSAVAVQLLTEKSANKLTELWNAELLSQRGDFICTSFFLTFDLVFANARNWN